MNRSLSENRRAFTDTMGRARNLWRPVAIALVLFLGPHGAKAVDKAVKMQPYYVKGMIGPNFRYLPTLYGLAEDLSRECPLLRVIGVEGEKLQFSKSNAPVQLFTLAPEMPLWERFKPWANYCPIDRLPEDGYIGVSLGFRGFELFVVVAPRKAPCLWTIEDCKALPAQWGNFATQQLQLFCAIYHLPQQKAWGMRWQLGRLGSLLTADEIILYVKTDEFAKSFKGFGRTQVEGSIVRIPFKSLDSIEGAIRGRNLVWKASEIWMIGVWRSEADLPRLDNGGILIPTWFSGQGRDEFGHLSLKDTTLGLFDDREALEMEKEHPELYEQ